MDEWTSLIERDRIERYAESFRQLAEIFREMPEKKERLNEEDIQDIAPIIVSRFEIGARWFNDIVANNIARERH